MRPRKTQRTNRVFSLPGGTQDNDLPAFIPPAEEGRAPRIVSVFELAPEERAAIATGKANVELTIYGTALPPVSLGVTRDRILPIDPGEEPHDDLALWVSLDRARVLDVIDAIIRTLAEANAENVNWRRRARLEALRDALLLYLPELEPERPGGEA